MNQKEIDQARENNLLCRMAGNICAGVAAFASEGMTPKSIASESVELAVRIRRLMTKRTDPRLALYLSLENAKDLAESIEEEKWSEDLLTMMDQIFRTLDISARDYLDSRPDGS